MNKIIEINNKFKNKIENLKNNLQKLIKSVNANKNYNQSNKNIVIKQISDEYNKKIQDLKNQYNIDSYDIRYDAEFNDNEIEDIFKKLVKENISHVKKWDTNFDVNKVPDYSALIEISNNNVNIIKCNNINDCCNVYNIRFIPFIKYLKNMDLSNINLKFIVLYCDNFDIAKITNIKQFDIPILCSSLCNRNIKIYNNSILIPNFYYYNNMIPINEMKINDLEYNNKQNSMIFAGLSSNKKRLDFSVWSSTKNRKSVISNLTPLFGIKDKGYEKYYNENQLNIKEQLQSKFLVSIDGSSTAWNGLIWKMYSNSLVFKLNQENYEYWYSLINKTNTFLCNSFDEMYAIMKTIDENSNNLKEMHINKKKLAKLITNDDFNKKYLREIFLELTKIQNINREITNTYDTQYGKITLYSNEIYIGNEFKNGKYWDEETLLKMKEYIDPTRNILEIGGHCGTSSIVYSSFLDEDKKIFVYEPQKKLYQLLVQNINQNNLQNKIIPYNLGVFCYSGNGNMNDIDIDGGGGVVHKRYNEEHYFDCNFGGIGLGGNGEKVLLTTIDNIDLDNIGFIHCDAQGAENFIFSKGIDTITKNRPVILYEDNANNQYYGKPLYDNVCKNYPKYSENGLFDIKKYCMEELKYSNCIENFNGTLDTLLIP
jgi:FkbM family methyltransferase